MRWVRAFGRFWWDFVVGDEWRIAVVVGCATALGALAAAHEWASGAAIAVAFALAVMLAACGVIVAGAKNR